MHTFKDNKGRQWDVDLHIAAVKRVRSLVPGVDLLDIAGGDVVVKLSQDAVLLCDTLYAVCKPQADAAGVTDEQFGEALAGEAIERATQALLEELVAFTPNPRDRAARGTMLKALNNGMDKARDLVEAKIENGQLDKAIKDAIADADQVQSGDVSGNAQESLE